MKSNYKELDKNFISSTNNLSIINNTTYRKFANSVADKLKQNNISIKNLNFDIKPEISYFGANVNLRVEVEFNYDVDNIYEADENDNVMEKIQKIEVFHSFIVSPNKLFNDVVIKNSFTSPIRVTVGSEITEFLKIQNMYNESNDTYYDYNSIVDLVIGIKNYISNSLTSLSSKEIFKSNMLDKFLDYTFERAVEYKDMKSPGSGEEFRNKVEASRGRKSNINANIEIKKQKAIDNLFKKLNSDENSPFVSSKIIYALGEEENFDSDGVEGDILKGKYDPVKTKTGIEAYAWSGSELVKTTIDIDISDNGKTIYVLNGFEEFNSINSLYDYVM